MGRPPVRVAAIDDHPVMLQGLQALARMSEGRVEFVASAATVDELIATASPADVVLLDLQLQDGSRPRNNVRALLAWDARVLLYTEGDRRNWVVDAINAGAQGIVLKSQPLDDVVEAVLAVQEGLPALSPEMADILTADAELRPKLSDREVEVLHAVALGMADKQVSRLVGIAEGTVKEYIKRIRSKYAELGRDAPSRAQLVRRAYEDGYAD